MEGSEALFKTVRPLDVTVLMGGPSSERQVSLMSGQAVACALEQAGHQVTRADIAPNDTSALDRAGIDVVFIALHGVFGESGEVQELCEQRSLPYVGSGPRASKMAMDKAAAKQLFRVVGLTTPDWMIVEEYHDPSTVNRWLDEIPPPVVVKPVDGGSSVHVTIARDDRQRREAIEELFDLYGRAMLERFVPGREMTIGILGDQPLPALEVCCQRPFYDYPAKYEDGAGTEYVFDHGLDAQVVGRLQHDALEAHRVLNCRDLSRVDFILAADGTPHVLEINTIPGFTGHSLVPKAAAKAGCSFPELVDRLVMMAMDRRSDRVQKTPN